MQDSTLQTSAVPPCRPEKRPERPRRRRRSASRAAQRALRIRRTLKAPPTPQSAGGGKLAPPLSTPRAPGPDMTPQRTHHLTPGVNTTSTTTTRGGRNIAGRGSPSEGQRICGRRVVGLESRHGRRSVDLHHRRGTGGVGVVQTGGRVLQGGMNPGAAVADTFVASAALHLGGGTELPDETVY